MCQCKCAQIQRGLLIYLFKIELLGGLREGKITVRLAKESQVWFTLSGIQKKSDILRNQDCTVHYPTQSNFTVFFSNCQTLLVWLAQNDWQCLFCSLHVLNNYNVLFMSMSQVRPCITSATSSCLSCNIPTNYSCSLGYSPFGGNVCQGVFKAFAYCELKTVKIRP